MVHGHFHMEAYSDSPEDLEPHAGFVQRCGCRDALVKVCQQQGALLAHKLEGFEFALQGRGEELPKYGYGVMTHRNNKKGGQACTG